MQGVTPVKAVEPSLRMEEQHRGRGSGKSKQGPGLERLGLDGS